MRVAAANGLSVDVGLMDRTGVAVIRMGTGTGVNVGAAAGWAEGATIVVAAGCVAGMLGATCVAEPVAWAHEAKSTPVITSKTRIGFFMSNSFFTAPQSERIETRHVSQRPPTTRFLQVSTRSCTFPTR